MLEGLMKQVMGGDKALNAMGASMHATELGALSQVVLMLDAHGHASTSQKLANAIEKRVREEILLLPLEKEVRP